jgi:predicted nucleotidyltransferase
VANVSRAFSPEERQYGNRSSDEIRTTLLELTRNFVREARGLADVHRIALLGSILTPKARPKDIDVLVTIGEGVNVPALARLGRRLKGSAQSRLNSGADVFLADARGQYLGRVCHFRECHPRAQCRARNCGARPGVADDFDLVYLSIEVIAMPQVELYPTVTIRGPVPDDVEALLLAPLRADIAKTAS